MGLLRRTTIMSKHPRIRKELRYIYKGKKWWKHLSPKDRNAFMSGFEANKDAEKIQKEEIKANKVRRNLKKL